MHLLASNGLTKLKPFASLVSKQKYFSTPKHRKQATKAQNSGKKASEIVLFKAPNNPRMTRIINFTTVINANASGAVSTLVDPALAVTGSSDWTSTVALFTRAKVHRCSITLYPFSFYNVAGSGTFFGAMVMYYDPAAAAAVSTIASGLDFATHAMSHSSHPVSMNVRLINKLGVTTPIVASEFVANFLGQLAFVAPNGSYTNSSYVGLLTVAFDCEFSYQK